MSAQAALGEQIFKDATLSASGVQSCASCHAPDHAFAPANSLSAQAGGATSTQDQQGVRSAPSIRYLAYNTAFHFASDGTPTGGFFWDGRASSLADQAGGPFLNSREMANADKAAVVAKLAQASYADEFRRVYGQTIFSDVDAAYQRMTLAIQAYEREDSEFAPFTSKYDAYLRGQTTLSDRELRGLALFNSPAKGNCAACHPSTKGANGSLPLFTDFTYDNLGVPRNWDLRANSDESHYDLGLCQRETEDIQALNALARAALCGAFKVPSLRNVALRQALFHNGRFTGSQALKEALTFYVQRDTNPEKWYLKQDGSVDRKFNDLPDEYVGNVNTSEAPYNRKVGEAPALSDAEIDDLIVFLNTLTDGWQP